MNVLFVIINQLDKFEDLLKEFKKRNIRGGTIFDTMGLFGITAGFGEQVGHSIRGFLNRGRPFNKTIMMVVTDEQIYVVKDAMEHIFGDINDHGNGIMVAFPAEKIFGMKNHDFNVDKTPDKEKDSKEKFNCDTKSQKS